MCGMKYLEKKGACDEEENKKRNTRVKKKKCLRGGRKGNCNKSKQEMINVEKYEVQEIAPGYC